MKKNADKWRQNEQTFYLSNRDPISFINRFTFTTESVCTGFRDKLRWALCQEEMCINPSFTYTQVHTCNRAHVGTHNQSEACTKKDVGALIIKRTELCWCCSCYLCVYTVCVQAFECCQGRPVRLGALLCCWLFILQQLHTAAALEESAFIALIS